jgi:hypothetical protein
LREQSEAQNGASRRSFGSFPPLEISRKLWQSLIPQVDAAGIVIMLPNASTQYMRREAAASYLQQTYGFGSRATLAKLASVGGGPAYKVAGRIPLYKSEDLDAWACSKISAPSRRSR